MLCDLIWSDPEKDINGWAENVSLECCDFDVLFRPTSPRTEGSRCFVHVRRGHSQELPEEARFRPGRPGPPGRRGRLRVLRRSGARHAFLGAQLLRRVRQRGRHDDR